MPLLGDEFRLWLDTSSDNGLDPWVVNPFGTWVRCDDVGDIEIDRAPKSIEIPKRGSWHTKYKQGRFDQRLTVSVNYDPDDTFVTAIEGALANRTHLHLALCDSDADITDIEAEWTIFHADYIIVGNPLSTPLDAGATFDLELAPWADSVNTPVKSTNEP